ncbi:MAG: hypothetical protein DME18_15205 [Verrucomicrobia bacterium]|nr:MAG: hypothetical protein DME19_14740 [Verrucomicrobiota bacterium]PYM11004.1 MAG: hypothetical protein DME18_15205 [Verrucomicrobiota bacterium]
MKKAILTLVCALAALSAMAQGTINFSNGTAGPPAVNAPISDLNGTTLLSGAGFTAQLWAGPQGTAWDSLSAWTPTSPFGTGASAGYFFGGSVVVGNVPGGSVASFQVRVWNSSAFPTWAAAWTAYQAGNPTAHVGVSGWNGAIGTLPTTTLTSAALASGAVTPPSMAGLTSFQLHQAVPEPSVLALGAIGALSFLLRRRK